MRDTSADTWYRIAFLVITVGIAAILLRPSSPVPMDFDLQWLGLKALAAGDNPYETVGPNGKYSFPFPYYYPLTATALVWPLGFLPLSWARTGFVLISAGVLGWVASRDRYRWLPMIVSGSFIHAIALGQWTPLLTAAILAPVLGFVAAAKPHLGIAIVAAYPSQRLLAATFLGGALLTVVSLVMLPTWPSDWLAILRDAPDGSHGAPILHAGGPFLLLALIRWRRPEARLLVALASVPQTGLVYDTLPLFLVCRTSRQGWILSGFSILALVVQMHLGGQIFVGNQEDYIMQFNRLRSEASAWILWLMYMPALAIVLLQNGGAHADGPPGRLDPGLAALR